MTLAQIRKLMRADLKRSGLRERDMYVRPSLTDLKGRAAPGYFIGYPDLKTGKPTKFLRYRYLEQEKPKYDQLKGVSPRVYGSRLIEWAKLPKGSDRVLLITEGEKKAEAACKEGFATLGLGGVWNFKSKTAELIDDLEAFDWTGASAYIVYDSDAFENWQVQLAVIGLAAQLLQREAKVFVVHLPQLTLGKKTGLDDYLVAEGKEALQKLLCATPEWQLSSALYELNAQYYLSKSPLLVGSIQKKEQQWQPGSWVKYIANTLLVTVIKSVRVKGEIVEKPREVKASPVWMDWPQRNEVDGIVYRPGAVSTDPEEDPERHRYIVSGDRRFFNIWSPWPVKAIS